MTIPFYQLNSKYILALLRIGMGWIYLWMGVDKLFGLSFPTRFMHGWVQGYSPTFSFFRTQASGLFAEFYQNIAGHPLVDWLYMLWLFHIGILLILGIGMKIATHSAALMTFLAITLSFPSPYNPLFDDRLIFILVLLALNTVRSQDTLGFGKWWGQQYLVRKYPIFE